jgi:outer membrane protein OmpA-like peptidoglycan-associated protein
MAIKNPLPFAPQNLGDSINTAQNEYLPSISADGNTLIFTRRSDQEDFYISEKNAETNQWQAAASLPFPINTNGNEGAHCLSPDGKQLYFTGCYRADGFGSCDLYVANRLGNKWGKPQNLGGLINSKTWETQPCISANGQELYFVSNREGGLGGSDIWLSTKDSTGNWAYPVNLGAGINTVFDDISPYIHPNNHDFYFASEGHTGLGDFDVFWATKQTNNQWNTPQNLGYPINTTQSESSLSVSIDGKIGYFASERKGGLGGKDIYQFVLPAALRPDTAVYYAGTVIDANTQKPLDASISIEDIQTKKIIYRAYSDAQNGSFLACLTPTTNKNYLINISKSGYAFYSENINETTPKSLHIALKPLEKGASLVLKNIFFDTNDYHLQPSSKIEIDKLLKYLQQQPTLKIEIQGHTDNVGNAAYNLKLSEQRAKAVYDFLIQNGAKPTQISHKGYGDKQPILPNENEKNRQMNRRTQVLILDF